MIGEDFSIFRMTTHQNMNLRFKFLNNEKSQFAHANWSHYNEKNSFYKKSQTLGRQQKIKNSVHNEFLRSTIVLLESRSENTRNEWLVSYSSIVRACSKTMRSLWFVVIWYRDAWQCSLRSHLQRRTTLFYYFNPIVEGHVTYATGWLRCDWQKGQDGNQFNLLRSHLHVHFIKRVLTKLLYNPVGYKTFTAITLRICLK